MNRCSCIGCAEWFSPATGLSCGTCGAGLCSAGCEEAHQGRCTGAPPLCSCGIPIHCDAGFCSDWCWDFYREGRLEPIDPIERPVAVGG